VATLFEASGALTKLCPKAPKVHSNATKFLKKVSPKVTQNHPGMRLWAVSGKRLLICSFFVIFGSHFRENCAQRLQKWSQMAPKSSQKGTNSHPKQLTHEARGSPGDTILDRPCPRALTLSQKCSNMRFTMVKHLFFRYPGNPPASDRVRFLTHPSPNPSPFL